LDALERRLFPSFPPFARFFSKIVRETPSSPRETAKIRKVDKTGVDAQRATPSYVDIIPEIFAKKNGAGRS
jgi:hypothetical protein